MKDNKSINDNDLFSNLVKIHSRKVSTQPMEGIKFDNLALRTLPIDPIEENYVRSVSGACFSKVDFLFLPTVLFTVNKPRSNQLLSKDLNW